MAHVILGLLILWPHSLYGLMKSFEAGISLFYSASIGSIKRAVDRLLEQGYIEVLSEDGPRGKKTYAVTDAGREEFRRWMLSEPEGSDLEAAMLPRVYFLGLLDAEDRSAVATLIDERIRHDLTRLEQLNAHLATMEVPDEFQDVATYQRATLQYGLASCRTALAWVKDYLPVPSPRS